MAKKVYGKRVKRTKSIYGKKRSKAARIAGTIVLVIALCGLVFAGYFIAKGISDYFKDKEKNPDNTLGWTPDDITTTSSSDVSGGTTTEPEPVVVPLTEYGFKAATAPESALENATAFAAYIENVKAQGYDAVVLKLKNESGNILYKSAIDSIKDTKVVTGRIALSRIFSIVTAAELTPIVEINTLKDSIGPTVVSSITYRFESGDYTWLDDYAENGGKQWVDPYQDETLEYLGAIVKELENAGFTHIIYSNTIFPSFRPYDETILAIKYFTNDRYKALTDVILDADKRAGDNTDIMIKASAKQIAEVYDGFKGTAELFNGKSELSRNTVFAVYDDAEIGNTLKVSQTETLELSESITERVKTTFTRVSSNLSGMTIVPVIVSTGISDSDLAKIQTDLTSLGYKNIVIQ